MKTCDVCGRSLEVGDIPTLVGLQILVKHDMLSMPQGQTMAEAMSPYKVGKEYNVCFPCWLKSLGVKP